MRTVILAIALGLAFHACGSARRELSSTASNGRITTSQDEAVNSSASKTNTLKAKIDFTQIRPILEARCRPCHFAGGTMYQRLPFDQPATITTLGSKLFTRIKDENERRLITAFLSQQSAVTH
jgi:uncharacterized membrane protein